MTEPDIEYLERTLTGKDGEESFEQKVIMDGVIYWFPAVDYSWDLAVPLKRKKKGFIDE